MTELAAGGMTAQGSRRTLGWFGVVLGIGLVAIAGISVGPYEMDLTGALADGARTWLAGETLRGEAYVLYQIRIPRVLFGLAVGAALGAAGAALQALFRNPLADPGLIGISAGATLGAVCAIVLGGLLPLALSPIQPWLIPATAFLGALAATLTVVAIGTRAGRLDVVTVLLAGIAINALVMAGVGILTYMADDQQLRGLTFWTMGSLALADWTLLPPFLAIIGPALAILVIHADALDRYLLGEAAAMHMGVDVARLKWIVVGTVALMVGLAVAFAGAIGFVGLVVPHLVRLAVSNRNRLVLPGSMLLGAGMLALADIAARGLASPAEIPVGLILGTVGGPFFLYLIMRHGRGEKP